MTHASIRIQLNRAAGHARDHRSPWVRKRDIARVLGPADPTSLAEVFDARGDRLGWGLFSPDSAIAARLIWRGATPPPRDWLQRRIESALALRGASFDSDSADTTGYRLVNSEGDGLGGLTVDRYGPTFVLQYATAPMASRRTEICDALRALGASQLIELSPEGLGSSEWLEASVRSEADDEHSPTLENMVYREHGLSMTVPAPPAQKTGAYHDQRENRRRVANWFDNEPGPLLDIGCHVGGFSLHAARAGIDCVAFDRSAHALEYVELNARANGLETRITTVRGDMFSDLGGLGSAEQFATIVLDPPKIVSQTRQVKKARAALTDACSQLLPMLRPHGRLVVCSCSHHMGFDELDRCAHVASHRRAIDIARVAQWGPGPDHPVAPGHVEGDYLRVAVYQRRP